MAVFSFSTKHECDTELIEQAKLNCEAVGQSFSFYLINLIREADVSKVPSNKSPDK